MVTVPGLLEDSLPMFQLQRSGTYTEGVPEECHEATLQKDMGAKTSQQGFKHK